MKKIWHEFQIDISKLFVASKTATGSLVVISVLSSIRLLVISYSFGRFIDVLVGARGLRLMTSDVTHWFWLTIIFLLGDFFIQKFANTFSGLMGSLYQQIIGWLSLLFTFAISVIVVPLHALTAIGIFVFAYTRSQIKFKKILIVVMGLLLFAGVYSIFRLTVTRDVSIGQFIFWTISISSFGFSLSKQSEA